MRFERVVVTVVILTFILKLCGIAGGSFLFVVSAFILAVAYFILSVPLILSIKLRDVMRFGVYKNFSSRCILISFAAGFIFSSTILGILYAIQKWVGARDILIASLISLAILLIINFLFNRERAGACYVGVFQRTILLGVLALVCLFVTGA